MPKSNSALNKFDKDTPDSIERRQYQELIANEFNDARSQVIKRLFEQSATYAEIFDKQQTLGNKVASFEIGKVLGEFKDSIERAKLKLEENEKKPFYEIFAKYSKLINTINAYINSTGARASDIAGITGEVRNFAPQLNELFIEGIRKQNEKPDGQLVDDDLINLNSLFDKIQSGYAEGQKLQGINLAGVVGVSESERRKLTEQLAVAKEMALNRPPSVAPFIAVFPSRAEELRREVEAMERDPAYRDQVAEIARKEENKAKQIARQQKITAEVARTTPEYLAWQQDFLEKNFLQLPRDLKDRQGSDFFEVPAKVDGEFVAPPRRPNREGAVLFPSPLGREGIDFNVPPPPPYSPLGVEGVDFNVGRGSARGGRKGVNEEMARNYQLISKWSGFPYFVPPSAPSVVSKNPRSRVNARTEANGMPSGSGKKKGKKSGKPKYNDI
jgi:hypothetical protein